MSSKKSKSKSPSSSSGKFSVSARDVPWVVSVHNKNLTFYSTATADANCKQYPQHRLPATVLPKYSSVIAHSPFGWLICGFEAGPPHNATCLSLFNPATLEAIKLPMLNTVDWCSITLTHPPTHPDCRGPKPNCVYFIRYHHRTIAFDVETGQSSYFMLAPPEANLYDGSGLFSIIFLSYDRGQTASTSRHCSSAAVEKGGTRAHQAIGYQEKEGRVASSSSKTVSILDLPLDMLQNITRRLTVVGDYRNLHSSCKTLRSIAPLITTLDGLALQSPSLYPWFFFFQHHSGSLHLHDLRCRNTFTNPQQLLPKSPSSNSTTCILFFKERWLLTCMEHEIFEPDVNPLPRPMFLFIFWNPFTKQVCSAPNMISPPSPISIGVSAAPTSPHCSIMGVAASMKDYGGVWFHFLKLNEGQWHYMEDAEANFQPSDHNTPTFLDNKFYFLDKKRKLGVFSCRRGVDGLYEWERDVYPWKLLPHHAESIIMDPHEDHKFKREYLVECGGEILSILVGDLGKSILVYRFDRQKKGWWRVKSLVSNMVFLSNTSCFSTMAKIRGMENKIYFPRRSAKGSIVFYSLDTRKYHTFDYDDEAMEDFLPTSEVHICGWIEHKGHE